MFQKKKNVPLDINQITITNVKILMNVRKIQKFVEAEPSAKIRKDRTSAFVKMDLITSRVRAVRTRTNVKNSLTIHGLRVVMVTVLTLLVAIHANVNQYIFIKDKRFPYRG